MGILIVALALFAGYGTAYLASEDVRYLTRAGLEQTRILQRRKPLEQLVADPTLPAAERAWLHLVLKVRAHAVQLGLDADQTYTTYTDVGRDTLLLSPRPARTASARSPGSIPSSAGCPTRASSIRGWPSGRRTGWP